MKSVCFEVENASDVTESGVGWMAIEDVSSRCCWIWIWEHWMTDDSKGPREAGTVSFPYSSLVRSMSMRRLTSLRHSLASLHSQTLEEHSDGRSRLSLNPEI